MRSFAKQELPNYLENKQKNLTEITWNEQTRKEIDELAHDYVLVMRQDTLYRNINDTVLENRFRDLVETWGPDINIVHPNEKMSFGDEFNEWIFQKVLRQNEERAHYNDGTLFYENKRLQKKEIDEFSDSVDMVKYDLSTSGLHDFCAELSHHINHDFGLQRSFAYTEDLLKMGFRQRAMYEDPYSSEYQAHSVTEEAIYKYLFPDDGKMDTDFVDIYNTYQEYYREIVKTRGYEKNEDINGLFWYTINFKTFKEITEEKATTFKNLSRLRDVLDNTPLSKELRGELFEMMEEVFPLENPNSEYELVKQEAVGLGEVLGARNFALENAQGFEKFADILEQKYKTDSNYLYASFTPEFFNKDLIKKMESSAGTLGQNNAIEKLFKLYLYGTTKSYEGNNLKSYKVNTYHTQWVCEKYEAYLKGVKRFVKDSGGADSLGKIEHLEQELIILESNKILSAAVENYVDNEPQYLTGNLNNYNDNEKSRIYWQGELIKKLCAGLEKHGTPDLKRDFFEDGKSPLYRVLE